LSAPIEMPSCGRLAADGKTAEAVGGDYLRY
jgi:hypothetical protein